MCKLPGDGTTTWCRPNIIILLREAHIGSDQFQPKSCTPPPRRLAGTRLRSRTEDRRDNTRIRRPPASKMHARCPNFGCAIYRRGAGARNTSRREVGWRNQDCSRRISDITDVTLLRNAWTTTNHVRAEPATISLCVRPLVAPSAVLPWGLVLNFRRTREALWGFFYLLQRQW